MSNATPIRILHISDLHLSADSNWDSRQVLSQLNTTVAGFVSKELVPDIVAITGDIANRGSAADYEVASTWIKDGLLPALGQSFDPTRLVMIPGNHDVERSKVTFSVEATQNGLLASEDQVTIKSVLSDSTQRSLMLGRHSNYLNFVNSRRTDSPLEVPWFRENFEVRGHNIRILGLVSSWMSMSGADKGRLLLGRYQLESLLADESKSDLTVALIHHPWSYFADFDSSESKRRIRDTCDLVLSGHLHETQTSTIVTPDSECLELSGGAAYSDSQYHNSFQLIEAYPTTGEITIHYMTWHHGSWIPDRNTYQSAPDGIARLRIRRSDLRAAQASAVAGDGLVLTTSVESVSTEVIKPKLDSQSSILAPPPTRETAQATLCGLPRFTISLQPQYRAIRQLQQIRFEEALRGDRSAWLASDWEMGKDFFLASVFERLRNQTDNGHPFIVHCEDCTSTKDIFHAAANQWGMSLNEFAINAAALPSSDLIFDSVDLVKEGDILNLIRSILDYCPRMRIALTCRRIPTDRTLQAVQITHLDQVDVRNFLEAHAEIPRSILDQRNIERFYRHSGGLPRHLDDLIQKLRVTSLDEVFKDEYVPRESTFEPDEPVPKDLIYAVDKIARSSNQYSLRSYRLLKVLTVLADGETLETIKRIYTNEPFHAEQATELFALSLIEVIRIGVGSGAALVRTGQSDTSDSTSAKLLRVPRQVRDYVRTRINEDEYLQIIDMASDVLFGRKWREGTISVRSKVPVGGRQTGAGNEHTVILRLLDKAIAAEDAFLVQRAARLGVSYSGFLMDEDRFREAAVVAEELVVKLSVECEQSVVVQELTNLRTIALRAIRMNGRHEDAVKYGLDAIETVESGICPGNLGVLYLNLALCYESLDDKPAALDSAQMVTKCEHKESGLYLQATSIIYRCKVGVEGLVKKLQKLETVARKNGSVVAANSIALDLARALKNEDKHASDHFLKRVLDSKDDDYNRMRAIAQHASRLVAQGRVSALNPAERRLLERAYSYSYVQRMPAIFDQCHDSLWKILSVESKIGQLLRLFRHSSFFWRIGGDSKKEKTCVIELSSVVSADIVDRTSDLGDTEVEYFKGRKRAID